MARITPDFTAVQESSFEQMPVGTYPTRITEIEPKVSKAGGQYLKLTHSVFGLDGDLAKFNNRKIWGNYMVAGGGAFRLKELLTIAGLEPKDFDTDDLLGKEVQATISYGTDQNGEPAKNPEIKALKKMN